MRTGYIVETKGKLSQNTIGVLVFNYEFTSKPCEIINHLIPYRATRKVHPNALGRWNVKPK